MSYKPFIEGNKDLPELLEDATKRFILKYAGYVCRFDLSENNSIVDVEAHATSTNISSYDLRPIDVSDAPHYAPDILFK